MMNFRQRMGWMGVALYLLLSAGAAYYVFETGQSYSRVAPARGAGSDWWSAGLLLMPVWVWAAMFLLPYLQVFLFLYSCTRADPRTVGYCILPICLALLCSRRRSFSKASNQISRLPLLDT